MDAQSTRIEIAKTQCAFDIISLLQLTAYIYPPPAKLKNESIFDFAIIGGGTAGCVVARRLAEDKKTNVLLIEAGGDPPFQADYPRLVGYTQNSSVDWKYRAATGNPKTSCLPSKKFDLSLGKMLGGSGAGGYMLYNLGSNADYTSWADAVNDSSWNGVGVLPYFIKSQHLKNLEIENSPDSNYFGYKGPIILSKDESPMAIKLLKAFEELGYPISTNKNIDRPTCYTTAMFNIGEGRKQHTAYSYLKPIKEYSNLHVLKNTIATKIIFDDKNRATSIQVVAKNKKTYVYNIRKEIIVSAGAINTPKLLMLSGVGPEGHIKNMGIELIADLPVGKNFIDPSTVSVVYEFYGAPLEKEPKNPHKFPASTVVGWVSLNESQCEADYEAFTFYNFQKYNLVYSTLPYGYNDKVTNSFFSFCNKKDINGIGTGNGALFSIVTNPYPRSRGEVLLQSTNYIDPPLVRSNHNTDPKDIDDFVKYIKDYIRLTNTKVFKKYKAVRLDPPLPDCQKFEYESDEFWKCYVKCLAVSRRSYVGTCAMGSVVDKYLYVKGVKGLRVVDGSVIPNPLSVAPFASIVMLAEKASDMIKKKYGL